MSGEFFNYLNDTEHINPAGSNGYPITEFGLPDSAIGTNGGFPDETWDGEWEGDSGNGAGFPITEFGLPDDGFQGCDGASCPDCGEPYERTYVVTATIQLCINGYDGISAAIGVKDRLNDVIAMSDYPQDPLNGAIIECVDDITVEGL